MAPYSWEASTGLPSGLTLSGNTIKGEPTKPGTFSFTVQLSDSSIPIQDTAKKDLTIKVDPRNESRGGGGTVQFTITTSYLPSGISGEFYSQTLTAEGGVSPCSWNITAGSLPNGLSLVDNVISGYPTTANTYNFTVQVHDSTTPKQQTAMRDFTIKIACNLTLKVTGSGTTDPAVGIHTFDAGTVVDIKATPANGWKFDNWTGDVTDPASASTTVIMNSSKTLVANFSHITYNLTIEVIGSGTTDPAVGIHTVDAGTVLDIKATPANEWKFDNWTGDVTDPASASTTVTMNSSKTLVANFSNDNWRVLTTGWTNMGEVFKDGTYPTVPGTVMKIGSNYVMYYHRNYNNGKGEIFVATSSSPTSGWTAYDNNPVLTAGIPGTWDEKWVTMPNVVYDNGTYYMFYEGSDYTRSSIGYATSQDGFTWSKQTIDHPLLEHGSPGWDGSHAGTPFVIKEGSTYYMYYHGNGDGDYTDRIGYATSPSITGPYTKCANNPTFIPSTSGWDSKWVGQRAIFNLQGTWVMMYEGNKALGVYDDQTGIGTQIGIATSVALDSNWNCYENNPVFALGEGNQKTRNNPVFFNEGSTYYVYFNSLPYDGVLLFYLSTEAQTPKITGVFPNIWGQGSTQVEITGTDFIGTSGVSFGEGIYVNSIDVKSPFKITASIDISGSATVGVRNVSVTNASGTDVLVNGFTINNDAIYKMFPSSIFNQTDHHIIEQIPIPSFSNWIITLYNTVDWASPDDNPSPRIFLTLLSGNPLSIDISEYANTALDIAAHDVDHNHFLNTRTWANPLTISLISGRLSISSSAGSYSIDFPSFSLTSITAGSTHSDICFRGAVYIKVEGEQ